MTASLRGWQALVGMGRRSEVGVWTMAVVLLGVVAFANVAAPRFLRDAEQESLARSRAPGPRLARPRGGGGAFARVAARGFVGVGAQERLARSIDRAPIGARQLVVRVLDDYPAGTVDDPLELQRGRLDEITAEIPDVLLDHFVDSRFVADSARFAVAREPNQPEPNQPEPNGDLVGAPPALPTFLTFRVHPELDDHSRLVAGRRAGPTDRAVDGRPIWEFELTIEAAEQLDWEIGDVVELTVDPSDPVTRSFNRGLPADFAAELVGLREFDPVDDLYWFGDPRLHRPTIADSPTGANVFAYAIVHPEQLPTRPFLVDQRSPFALEQRRDLDPAGITLDAVDETLSGVIELEASFASQPTLTRPGVVTGLRPALETEIGQRDAARSTLVLAAAGVLGVVLTTLTQLLVAAAGRRRGWLTVARARGASRVQVLVASTGEMAMVATVATLLGGGLALATAPRLATDIERPLLAATWLGAVLCAGLLSASEGLRPVTVSGRPNAHPGLGRWGRIAGIVVVATAAGAVVTFRRRGVAIGSPTIDPLVVLLPVLVPLAVVYVTRWTIPWLLGWVSTRGMALGPGRLVGLRRVAASPDATIGIVTVTVLALTVTALGIGVDRALEGGAVDASWVDVGAPFRIDTRAPDVLAEIRALPDTIVAAAGATRVNLDRAGDTYGTNLIALDIAAHRAITGGTAADEHLPTDLEEVRLDGSIPVVTSQRVNGRLVRTGDRFDGIGTRDGQVFHVIGIERDVLGRSNDFMLADRGVLSAASGREPGFETIAVAAPESRRARLDRIALAAGESLRSRSDVLAAQLDDPLSRAVRSGFLLAAGLSLVLALVALAAAAVVTARQRQREVVILGLLGAGPKETADAVVAELAPAAFVGAAVGSVVGWLVARSYDGRFDLSAFAAGAPVSIRVHVAGLVVAAGVVAVASLVLIALLVRRIATARAVDLMRIDGAE